MLVLTRKTDEVIFIGSDIQVTVVAIQGGRVRLGIAAPREISIRREELADWSPADQESVASETR